MPDAGPLEGIRIVEIAGGVAGPHAGKLLADYGADVVKVEPPGGDRSRRAGPFKGGAAHPEGSAMFLALNTNKRSVVADLETDEGKALLRGLLERADVLIEDCVPGKLASMGLEAALLRLEHPRLVICSITPYGQDGPYAGLPESDLVLQGMGGEMYSTGHATREPLRLGGEYALWHAGLAAAYAVMLAVLRAEATGHGEHIDCSIYETQAGGKDRRQVYLMGYAYGGEIARRQAPGYMVGSGVRPCTDGFVNLSPIGRLPALLRMIGREDLAARPEASGDGSSMPAALLDEIEAACVAWTTQYSMREAVDIAQRHRVLGGAVYTIGDVLADPTFRERGAFERIEHPAAGAMDYPARPFIMSASPRPAARRAPLLDEHRDEVMAELDALASGTGAQAGVSSSSASRSGAPADRHRLPLEGVRVIDLAVVWAGPFCGQLLAEWGAEVIKLEPITSIQPMTRPLAPRPGAVPIEGVEVWNTGHSFNSSSHNKRSFTADLRTPEGREAFRRLVAVSDVIVENNVPETIDRLGVSYEELRAINPGIVFTRMPGFGLSGQYRDYRAWGNHLAAMVGHLVTRAYPDATPDLAGEDYASDSIGGLMAAFATAVALRHRARTGAGQLIEVPQVEAMMGLMAADYLDFQLNGEVATGRGNDHRSHAPHNVYRCLGDDRWIAIDVGTDAEWRALCRVLRLDRAADDARFATRDSRWQHRGELDAIVSRGCASWDRWKLFEALVGAGVPAGPVQDVADAFHCRHLREREWFRRLTRSDIGGFDHPGSLFRWRETPNPFWRAPCRLGEDNEYVYRELLGYSAEEYRELVAKGVVGTAFTPAALGLG
ncbi:MAG: CaiB/BaiF CoA transferase family protein [Dehalococcoidia bacterium]